MIAVGIYARISEDPTGKGLGVARQEEKVRATLAKRLGVENETWFVHRVYVDNDLTAANPKKVKRPNFLAMLDDLTAGVIRVVGVWHTDRLYRTLDDLQRYIDACEHFGIPTYTSEQGDYDLSTSTGRMNARLITVVAQHEIEHGRERMVFGKQHKANRGERLGGVVPFGWDRQSENEPDAFEAGLIQDAAKDILYGASLASIARRWNQAGALPHRGSKVAPPTFNATRVRQIMLRPRNCGRYVHRGQVVEGIKGTWTPVLDEETFDGLRAMLETPDRKAPRASAPESLLAGIAKCGVCGKPLQMVRRKGRKPVYRCGPGNVSRDHFLSRDSDEVDTYVLNHIYVWLEQADATEVVEEAARGEYHRILAQKKTLEARKGELTSMYMNGVAGMDSKALQAGLRTADEQIKELDDHAKRFVRGNALAGWAGNANVRIDFWRADMTRDRRRQVIDAVCSITVMSLGQGGGTTYKARIEDKVIMESKLDESGASNAGVLAST